MSRKRIPVTEQVVAGPAEERLGSGLLPKGDGDLHKPLEGPGEALLPMFGADRRVHLPGHVPLLLQSVHLGDQFEDHPGCLGRLRLRLIKLAPGVRSMESSPYCALCCGLNM